jgi:hypothetical protein
MRKPNSNAVLKTLPDERQSTIAQHARDHSLEETVKWLAEDGLATSTGALSNFLSWYSLQQQLSRNASTVETLLAEARKANPSWTPAQIEQAGQSFFSALALEQQDIKTWFLTQQLGIKKEQLRFDQEKFQFDAAKACLKQLPQLKVISTDKTLSETQKVDHIRQKLFGGNLPK